MTTHISKHSETCTELLDCNLKASMAPFMAPAEIEPKIQMSEFFNIHQRHGMFFFLMSRKTNS